jgi:hypothetical protein
LPALRLRGIPLPRQGRAGDIVNSMRHACFRWHKSVDLVGWQLGRLAGDSLSAVTTSQGRRCVAMTLASPQPVPLAELGTFAGQRRAV